MKKNIRVNVNQWNLLHKLLNDVPDLFERDLPELWMNHLSLHKYSVFYHHQEFAVVLIHHYKVFEELSNELQGHLNKLDGILKSDFVRLNQMLTEKNLEKITEAEEE